MIYINLFISPLPKIPGHDISVGFQELSLADRGGRRRDFYDLGVNTRQAMEHVKESKTGKLKLYCGFKYKICS